MPPVAETRAKELRGKRHVEENDEIPEENPAGIKISRVKFLPSPGEEKFRFYSSQPSPAGNILKEAAGFTRIPRFLVIIIVLKAGKYSSRDFFRDY